MPGFVPATEPLLFRQKWPKPCWPRPVPPGALRGSPTPAAGKLAALKHCPPFLRCRLHCSAMPLGQGIFRKEKEDGCPITNVGHDEWGRRNEGEDSGAGLRRVLRLASILRRWIRMTTSLQVKMDGGDDGEKGERGSYSNNFCRHSSRVIEKCSPMSAKIAERVPTRRGLWLGMVMWCSPFCVLVNRMWLPVCRVTW